DQVWMGLRELALAAFSILAIRLGSTKKPFLIERAMVGNGGGLRRRAPEGFYFLPRGGRPFLRRRMRLLERWERRRVGMPLASWPQGETTCCRPPPPLDLPWPPPLGWSIGFMAMPRTRGRRPSQRLRPALPSDSLMCSALPTSPIVARHLALTRRISPEGSLSCALPFSTPTSSRPAPAARAIWAPRPGISSTACTRVEGGIVSSG